MKKEHFEESVAEWMNAILCGDSDNSIKTPFSAMPQPFQFTLSQLVEIAGVVNSASEPDKFILPLGETRLTDDVVSVLIEIQTRLAEIQVTYELSHEEQGRLKISCPSVTITNILSTDQCIAHDVQDHRLVLNSSHVLKFKTEKLASPEPLDINKITQTLLQSKRKLKSLQKTNADLAKEIEHSTISCSEMDLFELYQKYFKIITGYNAPNTPLEGIQISSLNSSIQSLSKGLLEDANEYEQWAQAFNILFGLLSNPKEIEKEIFYKTKLRTLIDKKILVFLDYVTLTQNATHEETETETQSMNQKEIKVLREIAEQLLQDCASANVTKVSKILNQTALNIMDFQSQISCSATQISSSLFFRILIMLITQPDLDDESKYTLTLEALTALNTMIQKIKKLERELNPNDNLLSYKIFSTHSEPIYKECLDVVEALQKLKLDNELFNSEENEEVKQKFKKYFALFETLQTSDHKSSPLIKLYELVNSITNNFVNLPNTNMNDDFDSWLKESYLPHLSTVQQRIYSSSKATAAPTNPNQFFYFPENPPKESDITECLSVPNSLTSGK